VHAGEVIGIAGLLGSGRTALLEMIFGVRPLVGGECFFEGRPWKPRDPTEAIVHGIVYVPEDRALRAVFPELSLTRNLTAPFVRNYRRVGWIDQRREAADAREMIKNYGVKARSERDPITLLSGGNQQKVVLGRWLSRSPRLVLLDEPTQGVDVGARVDLHIAVRAAADKGAGVLFVSSDFVELAQYSDRVLALRNGRIVAELASTELDAHSISEALHVSEKEESEK